MNIFNMKCPNCGESVARGVNYCPKCGAALSGEGIVCGTCGTANRTDASFCKKCGADLRKSAAPVIQHNHWSRREDDFAVRIETDDLPGLLRKELVVEPGTNAMLVVNGANQGMVGPGHYGMETFLASAVHWIGTGIPQRATALLVDTTPVEMEFHLGGAFTRDYQKTGLSIRLQVKVKDPAKFLVNVLKGRERYSLEDLRQYLYPEVNQLTESWIRQRSLQELAEDVNVRSRMELALEEALRTTFAQTGLDFVQVRTAQFNLEVYDRIKGMPVQYALQVKEAEEKLKGEIGLKEVELKQKQHWLEMQKKFDLVALAEENRKVEEQERKAELLKRMRQAVMSDKMDEVQSQAAFEAFLDDVDRQKLLQEKERAELLKSWQEDAEDKDRTRAHLLAKLDLERDFELRSIELNRNASLAKDTLDAEIALARKKADFEYEMRQREIRVQLELESEKQRIADERKRNEMELARLQAKQNLEDKLEAAKAGVEIVRILDANDRLDQEERLRIQRQHELEMARERQKLELERWEIEERNRQNARQHELNRLREMNTLNTEALIAVSPSDQGKILADLKRLEAFKGMSEEQILALSAENSPEVARALQEKFRLLADGKASEREKEIYERLLAERDTFVQRSLDEAEKHRQDLSDAWDKSSQRSQDMAQRAIDRMADTAQAYARNPQQPTIVTIPSNGVYTQSPAHPGAQQNQASAEKFCTKCGHKVAEDTRFCPHCGNKFEGVG